MRAVKEYAYAKVNLYLDVTARRPDGFHDVKTVMHTLSLSDTVTVRATPAADCRVTLRLRPAHPLPTDSTNIAYQAAIFFLEASGITAHVDIELEKNIPVAAGLAGGSSDAAAVLRAMNRLFNRHFSRRALIDIASRMGSDVAYCLVGKTMLCEGRGEIMSEILPRPQLNAVIAIADEHVSTPLAYRALDEYYSNFDGTVRSCSGGSYESLIASIAAGEPPAELFNIFESVILPKCPGASYLKGRLTELGAIASAMSGSGPSVFGIFASEEKALAAKDAFACEGYRAFACHTV